MENNSNPSPIPTVFHAIGLVLILVASFFGCMYLFNGNIILAGVQSIMGILVAALVVGLLVAQKRKDRKAGFPLAEVALLIVYGGLAFAGFFVISHLMNIEYHQRNALENAADNMVRESKKVLRIYEDEVDDAASSIDTEGKNLIQTYNNATTAASNAKKEAAFNTFKAEFSKYGIKLADKGSPSENARAADNKLEATLNAAKDAAVNNDHMENAQARLQEIKREGERISPNWDRFNLSAAFSAIPPKQEALLEDLKKSFQEANFQTPNGTPSFDYADLEISRENVIASPKELKAKYQSSPLFAILLTAALFLLTLVPYLTGSYGIRRVYSKEKPQGGFGLDSRNR